MVERALGVVLLALVVGCDEGGSGKDPEDTGAPDEVCNGVDDDGDGLVDDADPDLVDGVAAYVDADGDGYGDGATETRVCALAEGQVGNAMDCRDDAPECNPDALGPMDCEAISDCDCDGVVDHQCAILELDEILAGTTPGHTGFDYTTHADVTGDGVADIVASTPYTEDDPRWSGFIEVYEGPIRLGMTAGPGRITGLGESGLLGLSLAVADLDGDGVGDLLYTGPESEGGDRNANGAYVTFGPIVSASTSEEADWRVTTSDPAEVVSYGFEPAGDLDGDGDPDVVVGYTGYGEGGSVWLFTPAPGEWPDIAEAEVGVFTDRADAGVGASIAAGRDVNGDGQVDLVVGAPGVDAGAGEVRVFWGPITGIDTWDSADVTVTAEGADRSIGETVDVVDDLDNDGLPELFIPRRAGGCFLGASVAGGVRTADAPLQVLGLGSFVDTFETPRGSAVVTDLDADGNADIVVGNGSTSADAHGVLAVLRGPVPTGVLLESANLWWYGDPYSGMGDQNRLVGDTNGDGLPEVATSYGSYDGYGYLLLVDGADLR